MKKGAVLRFFGHIFMLYGIMTGLLNLFCLAFGKDAYAISTIFSLKNEGIGVATSFQFLLAASILMVIRTVFSSELLIKRLSFAKRTAAVFACGLAAVVSFTVLFDWFPTDDLVAWGLFFICFTISVTVSATVSKIAERNENRRLEEALKQYKEEHLQ